MRWNLVTFWRTLGCSLYFKVNSKFTSDLFLNLLLFFSFCNIKSIVVCRKKTTTFCLAFSHRIFIVCMSVHVFSLCLWRSMCSASSKCFYSLYHCASWHEHTLTTQRLQLFFKRIFSPLVSVSWTTKLTGTRGKLISPSFSRLIHLCLRHEWVRTLTHWHARVCTHTNTSSHRSAGGPTVSPFILCFSECFIKSEGRDPGFRINLEN